MTASQPPAEPPRPGAGSPSSPARRSLETPHPTRLAPDHPHRAEILAAHRAAMAEGAPGYTDPETGLFVMTAAHLLSRGSCCDSGCRHCPYT